MQLSVVATSAVSTTDACRQEAMATTFAVSVDKGPSGTGILFALEPPRLLERTGRRASGGGIVQASWEVVPLHPGTADEAAAKVATFRTAVRPW